MHPYQCTVGLVATKACLMLGGPPSSNLSPDQNNGANTAALVTVLHLLSSPLALWSEPGTKHVDCMLHLCRSRYCRGGRLWLNWVHL